jgi:protein TonB
MLNPTHLGTGLRARFAVLAASTVFHVGLVIAAGHAHAGTSASPTELTAAVVEIPAPEVETIDAPAVAETARVEPSHAASPTPAPAAIARHASVTHAARPIPDDPSPANADAPAIGTPQIIAVPPPGPLRFVMTAGPVVAGAQAQSGGGGSASSLDEPSGDAVTVGEASVDAKPALLSGSVPVYPLDAARDGIESDVKLEIVLDTSGAVVEAKPLGDAGHGLDEAALRAVRTYRFSRALRHGRPVRVRMAWTVMFRLD